VDDTHPQMEYSAWREERETVPTKGMGDKKVSAKRLSGFFKMG